MPCASDNGYRLGDDTIAEVLGPWGTHASSAAHLKDWEQDIVLAYSRLHDVHAARTLLNLRQRVGLVAKNADLRGITAEEKRAKAFRSFADTEKRLRIVGKRLRWYRTHPSRMPDLVRKVLSTACYDIFKLLGPAPCGDDIAETLEEVKFGPGAVQGLVSLRRKAKKSRSLKDVTPYGKLDPGTVITTTSACLRYWTPHVRGGFRSWLSNRKAAIVDSCRGTSVPKDALTDRFIAVEPYFNSYIQLGQMAYLAKRLKRWGVDLNDQSHNQRLAERASRHENCFPGGWATIDLSQASDSVHTELVRWLLPQGWFDYFDSTRSPYCQFGNERVRLEKFSSMGNGNTFPLQSLIYASLVRACRSLTGCKASWAVYGDDIIVSHRSTALLIEVLGFLGFRVNQSKTFILGYFRESCGSDFLGGHGVRPVYFRSQTLSGIFAYHNQLQARFPHGNLGVCALLRQEVGEDIVGPATSPAGTCDTHFVAPLDVLQRRGIVRWHMDLQNYVVRHNKWEQKHPRISARRKQKEAERAYLAFLASSMLADPHPVRGPVYYRKRVVSSQSPYWLAQYDLFWS